MANQDSGNNPESTPTPPFSNEYSTNIPSSEGRLERFFLRINVFFKRDAPPPTALQGRIQELQSKADKALEQLIAAKETLINKSSDPAFIGLLSCVMDPFTKEIGRIQRSMEQNATTPHQVKVSNRYADWIEKAKWWTETCNNFESTEDACPVLLEHAVEEFHARIDRDIQIIQDYLNQSIHTLELSSELQNTVERQLSMELGLHLVALNQLKSVPPEESVEAFHTWRAEADGLRERCFSDALHSIDTITSEVHPSIKQVEMSDLHKGLLASIKELEIKMALLADELARLEDLESDRKKECLLQLSRLEGEANNLNIDLRLSSDHSDRVQKMLEMLAELRERTDFYS